MKAKLSYKSKRNIVISVIIVALLAVISTGTYFFIKGNDDSSAAFTENNMQIGENGQNGQTEAQGSEGQDTTNPAENDGQSEGENQNPAQNPEENNNGETTENNGEGTTNPSNTGTTTQGQNGTTTNNGTTGTTTGEVPNEEYVTERVEEQEVLVSEDYLVEWQPLRIEASTTTANLSIIRPIISAEKTVDKVAVIGGELEYTIKVINKGTADGIAIVKDNIPDGTSFVEESIKIDGIETKNDAGEALTDEDLANGIKVNVEKQNEEGIPGTALLTFKVKVAEDATGVIINTAEVDGEEVEAMTPVVTYAKDVDIKEIRLDENDQLEGNRTLEYTITITNTETIGGKAIVADEKPAGTSFEAGTITVNGETTNKTEEELKNGIEVEVPAKTEDGNGIATVSFKVTIKDLTATIENIAYVNGQPTEKEKTKIEAKIIFEENGGTEVDDMNGYAGKAIEDATMPETTRTGYRFAGWFSDEALTNEATSLPEKYPAGTTIYYAKWTANTNTPYTVEYYYQKNGEYPKTATDSVERAGTTDTTAYVTDDDKTSTQAGYVFDENAGNVLSGNIAGDGSLVLKVYFKQQFTVTYKPGTQGTFAEQSTGSIDYGTATPAFKGTTTGNQGYTFAGWEPKVEETVTGNVEYTAQWTANTNTAYTVEYYYQKDGTYPETATDSVDRTGTTDTPASVTDEDKTSTQAGYVFDENAGNVLSGNIAGDGSLVLKVYFKQQFTVTYKPGTQGTFAEQSTGSIDYGTATPAFKGTTTGNQGYTFAGWEPKVEETVTGNVEYTAQWTANTNTAYTVEYYYQKDGTYPETATDSVDRTGTTDTPASVTDEDKTSTQAGYVFDENAGNVLSGNIAGDGSLVLKVYFKQQFTVTYKPGTQGTFAEQSTGSIDYGTATPAFKGTTTGNQGYTFAGWEPKVEETVTGNVEYTAQWTANTNTAYTVEYYYQKDGTYPETATDSVDRTGTTDTPASVTDEDKTSTQAGYVFDENAGNVLSGNIAGDGSLVLKVYFKQQFTVTYKPGTQGTFAEQSTGSIDYGTATPAFKGTTTGNQGYTFAGWEPKVEETVTGNVEYTAQWTANTNTAYTVEYYYQKDGTYPETATDSVDRTGTTDTPASVTDEDKTSTQAGYVFDENAGNVLSGNIAGDGSLVLKVYFKQQFTVTYKPGTQGTFAEQSTGSIDYGTATPAFKGTTTGNQGYTFAGWEPKVEETVTGNVEYTAQWTANTNTAYTVEYYYQKDGTYPETATDSVDRTGTTDTPASVTDEDKTSTQAGYVFDENAGNVLSGNIAGDGSLVLKVYFKQQFTVTYKPGTQGTFAEQSTGSIDYGTATPAFKGTTTGNQGYTFAGWEPKVEETVTGNVEYTAQWTANTNTAYTVEYYYQKDGTYPETATDSVDRTGTTDTPASVTDEDKTSTQAGYVFDENAGNVLSGNIAGDGSLVLKVYFKQQFTVTYKPGTQGTFAEQSTGSIDYGTATPAFKGTTTGNQGYTFAGWEPKVEETVTGNVEYTAQWTANEDTAYTVEYYYQKDGTYPETATDSVDRTGTTDTPASVTDEDKTSTQAGYVFDENAGNVLSGNIAGDGSLVLKVYFKQQFTVTYKPGTQGTFAEQSTGSIDYGTATPAFKGTTTGNQGYTFAGWEPKVEETVTGNVEYTAQWTANEDTAYTVEYYYQKDGTYPETATDSVDRTGTTDTPASVTDEDKTSTQAGYVYDEKAGNVLSGTITGDGKLVLKVYFKQQFTVTYKPGTQGTFAEQSTGSIDYGTATPAFKGTPAGKAGYTFAGWSPEVAGTVTGNAEYTALWEGLQVAKTRIEIVDKDKLGNISYVDQAGDIIKYKITVTNIGDVKATGIILTDDHAVTVTSVKIADQDTDISSRNNEFAKGENLLKDLVIEIENGKTIEVTVEYKVTEAEVNKALQSENKTIVNTATATLNNHNYTGTDKTDGKDGTDVKCKYTVEYYFNGKINKDYTIKSATALGDYISFETPLNKDGYEYIKYIGTDGVDNGSKEAKEGTNLIKVYYGKAKIIIKKEGSKTVDAGDNIEYEITVKNTGYQKATIKVTDELIGTIYVKDSAKVGNTATEPTITKNGDNQVLSFEITLNAATDENPEVTKTITFKAKAKKDAFGDRIENTANIVEKDQITDSSKCTTDVNEITVKYNEFVEGQKGTDLNIIFILDNSSSMNYPVEGKSYDNANNPIAPTDISKTRLDNAKTAINKFIDGQNGKTNTSMSVITFNADYTGKETKYPTLINESDITTKEVQEEQRVWVKGHYEDGNWIPGHYETQIVTVTKRVATVNGVEYEVSNNTTTGSDGKQYYYVYESIQYGARLVGTNATSNEDLKTKVDNISISSRKSGFATYVVPAFELINDNKDTYLSDTKKNIVIVLADGDFNDDDYNFEDNDDNNETELEKLKKNVDAIYSIGFGSNYVESSLKAVSTNNYCYNASNSSSLLSVFDEIKESATGTEQTKQTTNGRVTFNEATKTIRISENCPIQATYDTGRVNEKGEAIIETLFECTSTSDLAKYGIELTGDDKIITWDAKKFLENNPDETVPNTVSIKYYVPRTNS